MSWLFDPLLFGDKHKIMTSWLTERIRRTGASSGKKQGVAAPARAARIDLVRVCYVLVRVIKFDVCYRIVVRSFIVIMILVLMVLIMIVTIMTYSCVAGSFSCMKNGNGGK